MSDTDNNETVSPPVKYYAVVLHIDGTLAAEEFETLPDLVARLKALIDRDVSVFSFAGTRFHISKPPFRHLLTADGPLPLFDIPKENFEPDETGYLGVDPAHLENPPEIKSPTVNKSSTPTNEFFSDDDENVINVFDGILPDPDS
jgi:hypothetical protein